MILLPSRGRPHNLSRFIKHYKLTKATEPVCLILEADEMPLYKCVVASIPKHWHVMYFEGGNGAGTHINKVFARFPKLEYYGQVADDVVPETPYWDKILKYACQPDYVAYGDDGMDHTRTCGNYYYPTHPFIGGKLARKWGFIVPPDCTHYGGDTWWYQSGNQVIVTSVIMAHHHWLNKLAPYDNTYRHAPQGKPEKQIYRKFRKHNKHLCFKNKEDLYVNLGCDSNGTVFAIN